MNEQTKRMQILLEVAFEADRFYGQIQTLGNKAAEALTGRKRSQLTNLQGIANSALKVSEVLDYIKTQTARDKKANRDHGWHRDDFGRTLLQFIEVTLAQTKTSIYQRINNLTDYDQQEIHLLLIREAVRQLTAQYEFKLGDVFHEANA